MNEWQEGGREGRPAGSTFQSSPSLPRASLAAASFVSPGPPAAAYLPIKGSEKPTAWKPVRLCSSKRVGLLTQKRVYLFFSGLGKAVRSPGAGGKRPVSFLPSPPSPQGLLSAGPAASSSRTGQVGASQASGWSHEARGRPAPGRAWAPRHPTSGLEAPVGWRREGCVLRPRLVAMLRPAFGAHDRQGVK